MFLTAFSCVFWCLSCISFGAILLEKRYTRAVCHIGSCLKKWVGFKLSAHYEFIDISFMTAPVWKIVYLLDLLVNKYVHMCLKILGAM